MTERTLTGVRILVVEDEYLLAEDLNRDLKAAGAEVLGPVPNVQQAARIVASDGAIDAAVLDVHLQGELIFPVADALAERNIPFIFATGYDQWAIPDRFQNRPHLQKPIRLNSLAALLLPLMGGSGSQSEDHD